MKTETEKTEKRTGKKKKPVVVDGLNKINQLAGEIELSLPQLPSLPDLSSLATTYERKAEKARELEAGVTDAFKFLTAIGRRLAACKDRTERKFAVRETEQDVATAQDYLEGVFAIRDDEIYKSVVAKAYLTAAFSQPFENFGQADEMLNDLVGRGLLVDAGQGGPIPIGYRRYGISDAFGLDENDVAEVNGVIAKFSHVRMALEGRRRQAQTREMEKKSEIDLDDVRAGKNGKCLVQVPPESYIDDHDVERWRGGGEVLLDFRARDVRVIQASGSIEKLVAQMAEMGVELGRFTLKWDSPPGYGRAFQRVAEAVAENRELSFSDAEAIVRKMQTLWHLIQRGIKCFEEEKAMAPIKDEMMSRTNISAREWFGFNGSTEPNNGTALLRFRGMFRQQDGPSIFNPFFLVTKGEDEEGKGFFEVTEIPPHLQGFLEQRVGEKFPTSNDFRDCPEQLGRLIRAIRGQEDKAAQLSSEQ